jgi:hypothetical protein
MLFSIKKISFILVFASVIIKIIVFDQIFIVIAHSFPELVHRSNIISSEAM